jgi:hypothetical protein
MKTEIGRRNANDTKSVVAPHSVAAPGLNFFNRRHTVVTHVTMSVRSPLRESVFSEQCVLVLLFFDLPKASVEQNVV